MQSDPRFRSAPSTERLDIRDERHHGVKQLERFDQHPAGHRANIRGAAAFLVATNANRQKWLDVGMPKIVLDGQSEAQLDIMLRRAVEAEVPAYLVRDAGRTVIAAGTVTCLGLGPAPIREIDALTGALVLLKWPGACDDSMVELFEGAIP